MSLITWYLETMTLIIRHCPRWLFGLWLVFVAAWWATVFLYPSMAWTAFDLWWRICLFTFFVSALLMMVCWAAADIAKRRSQ
jgi:lysylphosphatidylglycerol synthetase-like protein (DUF2156 family)